VSDLFEGFDPMPYMIFIESRPRPGLSRPKAPLVDDQYRKFANKRSRSWPDADLVMLDAAVADQLGAFLRHPVADEVERAGMGSEDLIFIQRTGGSIEYQLVRDVVKR
jgi:hypothetical protein